jgi:hypothetical protein
MTTTERLRQIIDMDEGHTDNRLNVAINEVRIVVLTELIDSLKETDTPAGAIVKFKERVSSW